MSHRLTPTPLYHALDAEASEIRLLRLEGTAEPTSRPIKFIKGKQTRIHNFLEGWIPSLRQSTRLIKANLVTCKFHEAPPYRALSYTWGSSSLKSTLEVNGHAVLVQQNLVAALQRLQSDFWLDYVWVDALCINQNDDGEKSHQVPLMSQIYGRAEMVYIWLGVETIFTARAFSFLKKCSSYASQVEQRAESGKTESTLLGRLPPELEKYTLTKFRSLSTKKYRFPVRYLLENPYWRRIWVLQEVACAADALVVCGRHTVSYRDFHHASTFWDNANAVSLDLSGSSTWDFGFKSFQDFRRIVVGYEAHPFRSSENLKRLTEGEMAYIYNMFPVHTDIFRLFTTTREFKATDNRDKLYALLNLLPSKNRILKPNYGRSEAQTYKLITVLGLEHDNNLSCVSMGGLGVFESPDHLNTASWIPDFEKIGDADFPYSTPIFMLGPNSESVFNACGPHVVEYKISADYKYLTAKGFISDTIATIIPQPGFKDGFVSIATFFKTYDIKWGGTSSTYSRLFQALYPPELSKDWQSLWDKMRVDPLQTGLIVMVSGFMMCLGQVSLVLHFEAKLATINSERETAGLGPLLDGDELDLVIAEGDPSLSYMALASLSDTTLGLYKASYDRLFEQAISALGNFPAPEGSPATDLLIRYHDGGQPLPCLAVMGKFLTILQSYWSDRPFAITEGGYLGFARPGTQPGDKVCILHGCPVPLTVRQDGDAHVLVGDCYFAGMMSGEMIREQEAGKFPLQDIVLK